MEWPLASGSTCPVRCGTLECDTMADWFRAENLVALLTLTGLEIVLGIDNLVFLSILTSKLRPEQQRSARLIGLALAMGGRVALLLAISWVMGLTRGLFEVAGREISGRDLILLGGGLFLVAKSTHEIHDKLTPDSTEHAVAPKGAAFGAVVAQIVLIDIVFSLDSVITAVGMAQALWVMITAVVIAVLIMMVFSGAISRFIEKHPAMKVLALSFLILIGVTLIAEGTGRHFDRGYIYFAMAFALGVEFVNMRVRKITT
jgi:predicted tellurium resistance membrane protein TerC